MISSCQALVLWWITCTAQSRIFMSVGEGSSAVLPCDWRIKSINPSDQRLHIEWRTFVGTVFERSGEEHYEGEGYEDRVDVPEDKLKKGNCSLELKNVKAEDAGVYESYLVVKQDKRALSSRRVFMQSVELSVDEMSEQLSGNVPADRSSAVMSVPSQIIIFTILSNILT